MAPGQPQARERLTNLLWSDRSEDQARNSLRQTLSALKKSLAAIDPSPLQIDRTSVSAVGETIEVDALEFEISAKKINSHDATGVTGLYRGEFLEGLVIRDPNAEEWLATERDRYCRIAVEALENLIVCQREAGETEHAVETGEQLVVLDPLRESAWRQLMRVYATRGERNQALQAYNRCNEILKKELGVEPAPETTELQISIRDGTLDAASTDTQPGPVASADHVPAAAAGLPVPALTEKPSIVVLPFVYLGAESDDEYFAEGLTGDIIANLCRYRELFVIDHHSASAYRDDITDTEHFASEIGVEYVTRGNIRRSGDQIRISAQLIEAATGKTIWADRLDRKFDDIFTLEDEVSARIAICLVSHIEDESSVRAARKHPENMTAFDCVIRARPGVQSYDPDQTATAKRLLEQAIELDPDYAAAYAYLALSLCVESEASWGTSRQEALESAVSYARKAMTLDKFDSDAHTAMGWAYLNLQKYDLAEVHLDRAIECNPNDYNAFCTKSWLLALTGRVSEVMICGANALHLNPLAPDDCLLAIIAAHYTEGKYDAALEMLARIQEPDENTEAWRAACLAQLGRDNEAQIAAANALEMGGEFIHQQDWLDLYAFKNPQDMEHFIDGLKKSGVFQGLVSKSEHEI
jgi:TolB-like protein/Flp pilus assembly protein TadD